VTSASASASSCDFDGGIVMSLTATVVPESVAYRNPSVLMTSSTVAAWRLP
jgi:hypothetical protein